MPLYSHSPTKLFKVSSQLWFVDFVLKLKIVSETKWPDNLDLSVVEQKEFLPLSSLGHCNSSRMFKISSSCVFKQRSSDKIPILTSLLVALFEEEVSVQTKGGEFGLLEKLLCSPCIKLLKISDKSVTFLSLEPSLFLHLETFLTKISTFSKSSDPVLPLSIFLFPSMTAWANVFFLLLLIRLSVIHDVFALFNVSFMVIFALSLQFEIVMLSLSINNDD